MNPIISWEKYSACFQVWKTKKRKVCWRRRWHLRRIYIASTAKPGRRKVTGAQWRFGGSAPCINHPPGRATKTGIICGHMPWTDEPFMCKSKGTDVPIMRKIVTYHGKLWESSKWPRLEVRRRGGNVDSLSFLWRETDTETETLALVCYHRGSLMIHQCIFKEQRCSFGFEATWWNKNGFPQLDRLFQSHVFGTLSLSFFFLKPVSVEKLSF